MAFESLLVFFLKDALKVSVAYPAIWFGIGFAMFITCAVLYACNYRPNAKRKKQPTYLVTAAILFVIGVIVVTMIAVYTQAQISDPAQFFSYVLIPVAYLLNILVFAIFFYLFSNKNNN